MPISRLHRAAVVLPAAACLLVATPAFAADSYTVPLHQQVPLTAAGFGEHEAKCASVPASQDGWHFIAPGNPKAVSFVKLTVTFEPGGQQVVTSFGPPNANHAYVASAPGAKLTSAVAEVRGGALSWFNLSHTCPAVSGPGASPSPSVSASASSKPSPSVSPSVSVSPSSSVSPSGSAGPKPSGSVSGSPSSAAPVSSAPVPSGSPSSPSGGLAKTGSDAPVGLLAALAGGLIAVGAALTVRRRRAMR
ncbi:LPXTG cell wall anchor domain-containing protein [Streptomyces antimicrobicus]|uniref:LPXTG cell wall anchor domain-containing protein n=1 Tax=Streptomyces antimicrobicus TaxID=2883108 RepID=A0ABS8B6Y8_9ACTN|nr:LPXTG cell wall anchor domain-containing protein [Streptomyces antimicrobicus]MCB5180352.1 LPXTG cell wall anchor domain-containing protein [Streptomyces antimicrobicus]